ncbi:hypothetical protein L596_006629 [Steinernema carpocapsae]|uniref:Uncharacterized protein n=1 Tax=Steinernema carpocapsae TaxID=34508 RepID=A0A4U8VA15_STECR|nr:hypothetical protein L596_006629 [Steinernema carpocapsae]
MSHCFRQLRRDRHDWRRAVHAGTLRYRWSGRLRQVASVVVSADRCIPRVLLRGGSSFIRKCQGEDTFDIFIHDLGRFSASKIAWVPEIAHHCSRTPFLLVGTQIDLREDPSMQEKLAKNKQKPISFEVGEKLAKELKAVKYVECSALTQKGLKNVFDEAILAALEPPTQEKKRRCEIL